MIALLDTPLDPAAVLREFQQRAGGAGAVVSFSGLVRRESRQGKVRALYLQAYPALTLPGMQRAAEAAQARWPLLALTMLHRVGEIAPGDAIVFVATASAHRRAAFEAADYLMDYLKTEAVFWKRETTDAGDIWIEPRDEDYADRDRWSRQRS